MHGELTHKCHSDASLSRRGFLAGAASMSAVGAPIAAVAMPCDELADLIDQRRNCRNRIVALDDACELIAGRPDRPRWPEVSISEVTSRFNGTHLARIRFRTMDQIEAYVATQTPSFISYATEDLQNLRALYEAKAAAHDQWHIDTGFEAMQDQIDAIAQVSKALDARIAAFPCRSIHDVALKLDFLNEAFDLEVEDWQHLPLMLQTIREFAAGEA